MTPQFAGKFPLITGGGGGIGRASALALAADKASNVTGIALPVDGGYSVP